MTAAALDARSDVQKRWLFGPVPDLLLGCGGAYALLLLALGLVGAQLRTHQVAWLFPTLVLATSIPHYGATLVRVYEHRRDRSRYRHFTVHGTLALLALVIAALYAPIVGCWLATLYVNWSPWHYSGQNYGLAVMFLRRRGIDPTPREKRLLWASFVLSTGIAFVTLNVAVSGTVSAPGNFLSGGEVHLLTLGIPVRLAAALGLLLIGGYVAALAIALASLAGRAALATLVPTLALVVAQALWFSFPLGLRFLPLPVSVDPFRPEYRDYYFVWIAVAHAVQYLWVTAFYARASADFRGYGRYYGKTLLAGCGAWGLPVVLLAPLAASSMSYDSGIALLVASAVNLHHFVLDGAIWKLRGGRVAQVLIRSERSDEPVLPAAEGSLRAIGGRVIWGVLALAVALQGFVIWNRDHAWPAAMAHRDYDAAAAALDRLAWVGYDQAGYRVAVGRALADAQRMDAALVQLERSLALRPSVAGWATLGDVRAREGDWARARAAYERALGLEPHNAELLAAAGNAALASGDPVSARAFVQRAEEAGTPPSATLERLRRALATSAPQ
jgi:tetratricopeptide (TPR) repeat protein